MDKAGTLPLDEQMGFVQAALNQNNTFMTVLSRAAEMNVRDWYLASGCISQTIWNVMTGKDPEAGIIDYDFVYFDDSDLSWEAEDIVIQEGNRRFADIATPVQIRNQARVHLWYSQKFGHSCSPHASSGVAIASFPATVAAIGVRLLPGGQWKIYAPFGLSDIFNMIIRPNPVFPWAKEAYTAKAARWQAQWPSLTTQPWIDYQKHSGPSSQE